MKTIGFLISHKNNEKRRALLPHDLSGIRNPQQLYFEEGYGVSVGYSDEDYQKHGVNIVPRSDILKCDVIVDVKLGDADYLDQIDGGKILCGWAHCVQNLGFTSSVLNAGHSVVAWEEIYENGRYIFYRNREVAGEAAIIHGFRYSGKMPYDAKVAIIGNGQTGKGAFRILAGLGAEVDIYARKNEDQFRMNMANYDVLINCVMWDTHRTDRLIYREDLKKLRPGTLIIDVSCDPYLEIETSHPTTIDDPVYTVDGIVHYAVDNTPAMYPVTVTRNLSRAFSPYIDMLAEDSYCDSLKNAVVIDHGHILDKNIADFRIARGVFCK
jgi:N5-(carboxyethyl)ornithine synthase